MFCILRFLGPTKLRVTQLDIFINGVGLGFAQLLRSETSFVLCLHELFFTELGSIPSEIMNVSVFYHEINIVHCL